MKRDLRVLLAGMAAVALAFGVALTLGFRVRPRYPEVSDTVFGTVVALVLVGIAVPDDDSRPTGYEITFEEFRQLISEPSSQPLIASRLLDCYGYRVLGHGEQTAIRSREDDVVGIRNLHEKIQMDPARQRCIYGVAMDLWR